MVDIGTNSVRLLITDGVTESGRWVEVTGLGRGVDRTGALSPQGIEDTMGALARFGSLLGEHSVDVRKAIATSASRDASNRDVLFDLAESALGVRPVLLSGDEEAHLAFRGATAGLDPSESWMVADIGGGSTELVTSSAGVSVEIGSVRLTERAIPDRPPSPSQLGAARDLVGSLLRGVAPTDGEKLIGVAGTWTSLAAIAQHLPANARDRVHGYRLTRSGLGSVIESLAAKTLAETEAIPALDPKRAPVILGGALVAEGVMSVLAADEALISEHDTLDGVAMELLALA